MDRRTFLKAMGLGLAAPSMINTQLIKGFEGGIVSPASNWKAIRPEGPNVELELSGHHYIGVRDLHDDLIYCLQIR